MIATSYIKFAETFCMSMFFFQFLNPKAARLFFFMLVARVQLCLSYNYLTNDEPYNLHKTSLKKDQLYIYTWSTLCFRPLRRHPATRLILPSNLQRRRLLREVKRSVATHTRQAGRWCRMMRPRQANRRKDAHYRQCAQRKKKREGVRKREERLLLFSPLCTFYACMNYAANHQKWKHCSGLSIRGSCCKRKTEQVFFFSLSLFLKFRS